MSLFYIHGFLGCSKDWDPVAAAEKQDCRIDLFHPSAEADLPEFSFSTWSQWLVRRAYSSAKAPVLVGYSLGGRIALHALINDPNAWSGAVIISAHPGLEDPKEKAKRVQSDEIWAKRFELDCWEQVISDWNAQGAFQGGVKEPLRLEKEYSRQALAQSLRGFSLGFQEDLRPKLKDLKVPILWVVGEKDQKFKSLAESLPQHNSRIQLVVIPNSGHRVLFDQPQVLKEMLSARSRDAYPSPKTF